MIPVVDQPPAPIRARMTIGPALPMPPDTPRCDKHPRKVCVIFIGPPYRPLPPKPVRKVVL
jgi:hypothetical protein